LSFDAWSFFPQADDIVGLARAFPDVPIVIDHCGGIVRIRGYETQPDVYTRWRNSINRLADCPNVVVKLSGLGMRLGGFGFEDGAVPPSSLDLAAAWRPWVMQCIDSFGPERCMWGSNFPVDKSSYAFGIGLNAMKRLIAEASADERDAVFRRTASRVYQLSGPSIPPAIYHVPNDA
jgi:predicted TIM-barrel fold metal-dependent hydrolase